LKKEQKKNLIGEFYIIETFKDMQIKKKEILDKQEGKQ